MDILSRLDLYGSYWHTMGRTRFLQFWTIHILMSLIAYCSKSISNAKFSKKITNCLKMLDAKKELGPKVTFELQKKLFSHPQSRDRIIKMAETAFPGVFSPFISKNENSNVKFMFPAPLWLEEGQGMYLIVCRVYVFDHSSVLYAGLFDVDMVEILDSDYRIGDIKFPSILPIGSPCGFGQYTGPEDPRIYTDPVDRSVRIVFNMNNVYQKRSIYVYVMNTGKLSELMHPSIRNYSDSHTEKNWVPIVIGDAKNESKSISALYKSKPKTRTTYFIVNQEGPAVLGCNVDDGVCSLVQGELDKPISQIKSATPILAVPGAPGYFYGLVYLHTETYQYRSMFVVFHLDYLEGKIFAKAIYYSQVMDWANALVEAGVDANSRIQISTGLTLIASKILGAISPGKVPNESELKATADTHHIFVSIDDQIILVLKAFNILQTIKTVIESHKRGELDCAHGDTSLTFTSEKRVLGVPIISFE